MLLTLVRCVAVLTLGISIPYRAEQPGKSEVAHAFSDIFQADPFRTTKGRLAGPLPYGPYVKTKPIWPASRMMRFEKAISEHIDRAQRGETWRTLWGNPNRQTLREAANNLEAARVREPNDPRLLNDLAVCYMELVFREGESERLPVALALVEHALRIQPDFTAAQFNQGVLLFELGLHRDAEEAFQRFLVAENDAGWRAEAGDYLHILNQPSAIEQWPEVRQRILDTASLGDEVDHLLEGWEAAAWVLVEEELLPGWGRGENTLAEAEIIAQALARALGDNFLAITIQEIRARPNDEASFRRGFAVYGDLINAYPIRAEDLAVTMELLEPLIFLARVHFYQVIHEQETYNYAVSMRNADKLLEQIAGKSWVVLESETLWVQALNFTRHQKLGDALTIWQKIIHRLEQGVTGMKLEELLGGAYIQAGGTHATLGEYRIAWRQLHHAHQMQKSYVKRRRMYQLFANTSYTAWRQGQLDLSVRYSKVIGPWANSAGDRGHALVWTARFLYAAGRTDEARLSLEKASEELGRVSGKEAIKLNAEIIVAQNKIAPGPERSSEDLHQVLDTLDDLEHSVSKLRVLEQLVQNYLESQEEQLALKTIYEAIALYEENRLSMESHLRSAHHESIENLFHTAVAIHLSSGEYQMAWSVFEQSRNRILLDRQSGTPVPVYNHHQLLERLPSDHTMVVYAFINHSLGAWVVNQDEIQFFSLGIARQEIETQVAHLRAGILKAPDLDAILPHTISLHKTIIDPLKTHLRGERLVIVPDGPLHHVYFAALAGEEGRPLCSDYILITAASGNHHVLSLERAETFPAKADKSLVVGADVFERRKSGLGPLPAVRVEALTVAGLYGVDPLLGGQATVTRVAEEAADSSIIHFACHAISNTMIPGRSKLFFAPDPTHPDGALNLRELQQWSLPHTRLVVLAACQSASGPVTGSDGVISISRGFLEAGVPTVVAGLGNLRDKPTADIITRFHHHRVSGYDSAEALALAQREAIVKGNPPNQWAALLVLGAGK